LFPSLVAGVNVTGAFTEGLSADHVKSELGPGGLEITTELDAPLQPLMRSVMVAVYVAGSMTGIVARFLCSAKNPAWLGSELDQSSS
jgi:hypothetical protein